jgi:hypothetical protein
MDNIFSLPRTNYENRTLIITDISYSYYIGSTVQSNGLVFPCYTLVGFFEDNNEMFSTSVSSVEI